MSQRNRITIGRVKGSMIYTGVNPKSVRNPLDNDLYFHTKEYKFYCYNDGSWTAVSDLREHVAHALSEELEDKEVLINIDKLTQKVNNITDLGEIYINPINADNDALNNIKVSGFYTFIFQDRTYLMLSNTLSYSATTYTTKQVILYGYPNLYYITRVVNPDGSIDVSDGSRELAEVSTVNSQLSFKVDKSELTENYYKKQVVNNMINSLTRLTLRKIYSLPEVGEPNVIYLLVDPSGKQNEYKEYLYVDNQWELIGSTEVDLNGYVQDQDVTIQNETATSKTVGGIAAGTILKGKTVLEVLEDILYPYVAFSVSISGISPSPSPYEKGTSATIKGVTVKITPGSKPVTNIKLYESDKTTLLGEKTSDISTNNTFSINKVVTSTTSFYVEASDGTNTISATASFLSFYYPTFYGVLNEGYTLNNDTIKSGQKSLKSSKSNTYTFTATNQHPFVAYPASYGNITSIKDSSNLEYIGDFTKTTMNLTVTGGTISYNVYVLKNPTDITNYKFIFS